MPYETRHGQYLPAHGVLRVLVVLCEVAYQTPGEPDPTGPAGRPEWPAHQLPTWANNPDPDENLFDTEVLPGGPRGALTRYYHEASSGNLTLLGDYLLAPTNGGLFSLPSPTGYIAGNLAAVSAVNAAMGGSFTTYAGHAFADFDNYTIDGPQTVALPKTHPSTENPRKYDHVCFIYRNIRGRKIIYAGGVPVDTVYTEMDDNGSASAGSPGSMLSHEANTWSRFAAYDNRPVTIMRHELAHLLYGGNNFHYAGGGNGSSGMYWIGHGGGWGNLSLSGSSLQTWSAWDRLQLGWQRPGQVNPIAARNPANTLEVNGELDPAVPGTAGTYVLRDFVATGDALRIKLPYLPGTKYPQYIWVENHQGHDRNGDPFDRFQFEDADCTMPAVRGLYMYVQIDREKRLDNTSASPLYSGFEEFARPLSASGAYDVQWVADPDPIWCVGPPDSTAFVRAKPNPLTGYSDTFAARVDRNGDNILQGDENRGHSTEYDPATGQVHHELFGLGHSRQAFTYDGQRKVGMDTNPSSASMMSLRGYDQPLNADPKNLRHVYLNGISIYLADQLSSGAIAVTVRYDDVDITRDVRWCADTIDLNPIPSPSGWSLNLKAGKTLLLDQGTSATRRRTPISYRGQQVFASPTLMRVLNNAKMNLEAGSTVVVDNGSTLRLESGSRLDVSAGAVLRVKRGGTLDLQGGVLNVAAGGLVVIEEGGVGTAPDNQDGTLIHGAGTRINLNAATAELKIAGQLVIGSGATFQPCCTASTTYTLGRVRFADTNTTSTNITAGTNSRFVLRGQSTASKILYVDQESLYGPAALVEFTLETGTAIMVKDNARIVPPTNAACQVTVRNAAVTTDGTTRTGHRGLWLNGQPGAVVQNSTFSNGSYGLYDNSSTLGGSLTVQDCRFTNCGTGLYLYDHGLTATDCTFSGCNTGLQATNLSASSTLYQPIAKDNSTYGVYLQGMATVTITAPSIANNGTTGLRLLGSVTAVVGCGSIRDNGSHGIYVGTGATLRMDGPATGTLHKGVRVTGNPYSIYTTGATAIYLDQGRNNLQPTTTGVQKSLYGTMACVVGPATLQADRNNWNGTTSPLTTADYSLTRCSSAMPVVDATPQTTLECLPAAGLTPMGLMAFADCPDCRTIDTELFPDTKLDQASNEALVLAEDSMAADNELQALEGFKQILTEPVPNASANEAYLLGYDQALMKESYSDAFAKGQLVRDGDAQLLEENLGRMGAVQDKLIAEAVTAGNYDQRLLASVDKAQTMRAAGRLDDAVELFISILAWTENEEDAAWVEQLRCLTMVQRNVIGGLLDPNTVDMAQVTCAGGHVRSLMVTSAGEGASATDASIMLFPNPTTGHLTIQGLQGGSYEAEVLDPLGRSVHRVSSTVVPELDLSRLVPGPYTVRFRLADGTTHAKAVLLQQ